MDTQDQEVLETSSSGHEVLLGHFKLLEEPPDRDTYMPHESLDILDVVAGTDVEQATSHSVGQSSCGRSADIANIAEGDASSEAISQDGWDGTSTWRPTRTPTPGHAGEVPAEEISREAEECGRQCSAAQREPNHWPSGQPPYLSASTSTANSSMPSLIEAASDQSLASTSRANARMPLLIAAAASCEEPIPPKSLPSKMERMQFSNSVDLETQNSVSSNRAVICIRVQRPSATRAISAYNCQKCSFRTTRMQNLVRHTKSECAFVKDFFSWDANTFIEVAKRKEDGPSDVVEDVTPTVSVARPPKQKHQTKRKPDVPSPKKRRRAPVKSRSAGSAEEESSDSDLEPVFSAKGMRTDLEFSEDDVVWVEWNHLHWPALVLKVYSSRKKAKVFLIDSISSKDKVLINVKKIFHFNSAERNKRFLNEGRVGRNSGALVKAVQKAEDFLRKRCLGIHINAKQFFCDGEVLVIDDDSEDSSSSCVRSGHWSSPAAPLDMEEQRKEAAACKLRRKVDNEILVEYILDGKSDDHLLGVLDESIESSRHKKFKSYSRSVHLELKSLPWFGPIDDPIQQEQIFYHCFNLLMKAPDVRKTFDTSSYSFEVWCPEAVKKAISSVRCVTMSCAEEIVSTVLSRSDAEHEVIHHDMLGCTKSRAVRKAQGRGPRSSS